jgi:hypothetical protein
VKAGVRARPLTAKRMSWRRKSTAPATPGDVWGRRGSGGWWADIRGSRPKVIVVIMLRRHPGAGGFKRLEPGPAGPGEG